MCIRDSYEIPGEALDDPAFAARMKEATKYIGWPYVWGGSSPVSYTHLACDPAVSGHYPERDRNHAGCAGQSADRA